MSNSSSFKAMAFPSLNGTTRFSLYSEDGWLGEFWVDLKHLSINRRDVTTKPAPMRVMNALEYADYLDALEERLACQMTYQRDVAAQFGE